MDYASSYAVGGPQPQVATGMQPAAHAAVLPPPRPQRMHWSTILFTVGMAVCAIALLFTIAGVPGRLGYDVDGAPDRNKPNSNDPMKIQASIDGNMKWIDANSADAKGKYLGSIKSVNRNAAAIGGMAQALMTMDAAVARIDAGLGAMGDSTRALGSEIDAMAATSSASAGTMQSLGDDIGFLSRSMVGLADATEQLTTKMSAIEAKAAGIADGGTSAALQSTKELNQSLPEGVPVPVTDEGEPYDVAMQRLATTAGGGEGARDVAAEGALVR